MPQQCFGLACAVVAVSCRFSAFRDRGPVPVKPVVTFAQALFICPDGSPWSLEYIFTIIS